MIRLFSFVVAALALFAAGEAQAHPHVWVTMKSEVVYGADGTATGVRHAWTFDDMFSTFATQGLASKEKGKFTREELAPLAEVNVSSLKDFDYFTVARANGKKADLNAPVDYYLEFTDGLLDAALHLAARDAREGAEPRFRDGRSDLFRRLLLRREGARAAHRRAAKRASSPCCGRARAARRQSRRASRARRSSTISARRAITARSSPTR